MNKARKRFILLSELSIITLLAVLLSVINIMNFTMAAEDADMITGDIAKYHGVLVEDSSQNNPKPDEKQNSNPNGSQNPPSENGSQQDRFTNNGEDHFSLGRNRKDLMGPKAKDMNPSLRFFTYAFDEDGDAEKIAFRISAVSEEEAEEWARSLLQGTKGWTNTTFRYRVYESDDKTYVTVVDQGRELYPSYRILMISVIGGLIMIGISFILLLMIGKKLFKPVEEADRKQQLFLNNLEREFKMPLTVINADTETLEREGISNDHTRSINKQVKRMIGLVKELSNLNLVEDPDIKTASADLSDLAMAMFENARPQFTEKKIGFTYSIDPGIMIQTDEEAVRKMLVELISNSLKFSSTTAEFTIRQYQDRITIIQKNDTKLSDGTCDQIFDRFMMLENAEGTDGSGLGLAYVKELVRTLNGRVSAGVKDGWITITIDL